MNETNSEGSILVVWPGGANGDLGIRKFADYTQLRAAPGAMLSRFAIAGVGSSDIGAAAFARAAADRYQEPVGAIVAGYGVADLLSEALGGWFVLGAANQLMQTYHAALTQAPETRSIAVDSAQTAATHSDRALDRLAGRNDSETLLRLLLDEDRTIASVSVHSKGCLSIAYAIEGLAFSGNQAAIEKAEQMRITTAGAVVQLPSGYENLGQYLGGIDWFGRMNSRLGVKHWVVPGAWHHLNTALPMHMDFGDVLAKEPD